MSGFIRVKSRQVMSWTLVNTRRAHTLPNTMSNERPLEGRTVVVCGAGPSLKRNGGALLAARDKGIPILTTNAGDAALRDMGIRPDVVLARESLDLSDQAAASEARAWILDVSSHPGQWNICQQRDDLAAYWYLPLYPRHIPLSRMLGVRPIPSGSSALCGMVTHAITWGASRIVLCGVDLAISEDGSVYHPGAPRGALTATVDGETLLLEGDDADHERARRTGQQPQGSRIELVACTAADWSGMRAAKTVFQNQREWLSEMASPRRHGLAVDCVNATEGGSGILGWRHERLAEVLHHEHRQPELALPTGTSVPVEAVEETVRRLVMDAKILRNQAQQLLDPAGPDLRMLPYMLHTPGKPPAQTIEGDSLIEALAAWQTIDVPDSPPEKRIEGHARAWLQAAEEALECLTRDWGREEAAA